jgi:NADH-quinone oxidoreductase subunit J
MRDFLFYVCALLSIGSALGVILSKNTVNSAMYLILCFLGLAGLFALLEAYFLAILQVLVYAGAIMVLFLFIIMLLDVDTPRPEETKTLQKKPTLLKGLLGLGLVSGLICFLYKGIRNLPYVDLLSAPAPELPIAFSSTLKALGTLLFTKYLLVLELAGLLLLIVMLGAIALSKPLIEKPKKSL